MNVPIVVTDTAHLARSQALWDHDSIVTALQAATKQGPVSISRDGLVWTVAVGDGSWSASTLAEACRACKADRR